MPTTQKIEENIMLSFKIGIVISKTTILSKRGIAYQKIAHANDITNTSDSSKYTAIFKTTNNILKTVFKSTKTFLKTI